MNEQINEPMVAESSFPLMVKPNFRYAVINRDMIVEKIVYGAVEGEMDPVSIVIDSEIAEVGWFYDPVKERFSFERDPNAIATYQDLLNLHGRKQLKKLRDKRRINLEKNRDKIIRYLGEIVQRLKELESEELIFSDEQPIVRIECK